MSTGREIRLIEEDDGWWSAVDEDVGVASQGPTREEALVNLDEAVSLTEEAQEADTDGDMADTDSDEADTNPEEADTDSHMAETEVTEPDAPWFES